jgi:ATP-dependent DNA helicase RecQ
VYPDFTSGGAAESAQEEAAADAGWDAFGACLGGGGDFDPVALSQQAGVPLPELEATLLRFQDAGHLTYRAAGGRALLLEILCAPADTKTRMEATLAHRVRGAKRRAEAMQAYARDARCRHGAIARYFGDRWPNLACGACDVCVKQAARTHRPAAPDAGKGAPDAVDPASAPLAALRIVADLANGYRPFALGKSGLMRALRGTPDAPIQPGRTSAFGTLAGMKKAEVERLIEALIARGYLRRDEDDEYRRLYLTAEGRDAVAAGEADVEWRLPSSAGDAPAVVRAIRRNEPLTLGDVDEPLYEALRSWRRATAERENVPPYVVFADKVLLALAAQKPTNEFDLLDIPGIGPAKAAKFGDALLEIIRAH